MYNGTHWDRVICTSGHMGTGWCVQWDTWGRGDVYDGTHGDGVMCTMGHMGTV